MNVSHRFRRPSRFAVMALAVGAAAVAVSSAAVATAARNAGGTINFGYINALTGPYAVAGVPELNGLKLGVADINASGGVCGQQLKLAATADDQGQANLSTAGFRKLVQQDGLKVIIGPTITPPGLADAPLAESLKVVQYVLTSQRQTWQGRHYVFSIISPQDVYAPLMVNYISQKLGPGKHKVAILYANVPYGQFGFNLLTPLIAKKGWNLVVTDNWDPAKFDFSSQAQKVASAKPDALFLWGAASPADAQILKQLRAAGYKGPAVGEVAFSLPGIPQVAGAAATTVVAFSQLNVLHPDAQTKKFLDAYVAQYKQEPNFLPAGAYDAVHVFAAAIKRAGCKSDPDSLVKAMNGLTYKGVTGAFGYTANYKSGPGVASFFAITYNKAGKTVLAP